MPTIVFDPIMQGLSEALTVHQRRHEVLASNLANLETPGYRARELDFAATLHEAFTARDEAEPAGLAPAVVEDASAPRRADGNTVDLDLQMAKLAENGTGYLALARILGQRIALLRQAIDGTR